MDRHEINHVLHLQRSQIWIVAALIVGLLFSLTPLVSIASAKSSNLPGAITPTLTDPYGSTPNGNCGYSAYSYYNLNKVRPRWIDCSVTVYSNSGKAYTYDISPRAARNSYYYTFDPNNPAYVYWVGRNGRSLIGGVGWYKGYFYKNCGRNSVCLYGPYQ
jgi:hypothetical protein